MSVLWAGSANCISQQAFYDPDAPLSSWGFDCSFTFSRKLLPLALENFFYNSYRTNTMSSDTSMSKNQTNVMFHNYSSLRVPQEQNEEKQIPGKQHLSGQLWESRVHKGGGREALFSKPSFWACNGKADLLEYSRYFLPRAKQSMLFLAPTSLASTPPLVASLNTSLSGSHTPYLHT